MSEQHREITLSKEELLSQLARLKEVSNRNEELAKEIGQGGRADEEILREMDGCVAEQSTIVDHFLGLSDDEDAKTAFRKIVSEIEGNSKKIELSSSNEEMGQLKERLLVLIESWITSLEEIITGVIARAED